MLLARTPDLPFELPSFFATDKSDGQGQFQIIFRMQLRRCVSCYNFYRKYGDDILEIDKDYNLTVGLRIREIREAHNMTRAEFSEKCDISDSFLAAVESGRKSVTSKTLYKICSSMDVSADYIIRGNKNGFESDMIIEMINSMDKYPRETAIRILREYITTVNYLSDKNRKNDSE